MWNGTNFSQINLGRILELIIKVFYYNTKQTYKGKYLSSTQLLVEEKIPLHSADYLV